MGSVGGAVSVVVGSPTIRGCTFIGNGASLGGAVANDGGAATTIVNSGFYGDMGTGGSSRGGASSNRSTITVANCVFSGNTATNGGEVTTENAALPR